MALPFTVPQAKPPARESLELSLKLVTPTLGGGVFVRELDAVDTIRTASIRGQLRFWWRAITADVASQDELYARETALWGGVTGTGDEAVTKSEVRISVAEVVNQGDTKEEDVSLRDAAAYALWPARGQPSTKVPPAPRWNPGLSFKLRIIFPRLHEAEIKRTLSAWLCFGGYGARTRRGVGKVAPGCESSQALVPATADAASLEALLGDQLFRPWMAPGDWPRLKGVQVAFGNPGRAEGGWATALNWLRDFRQGQPSGGTLGSHSPQDARVRGDQQRPSISNWPEADKARQLSRGGLWEHSPQHNATPVWPRAVLGLPIQFQFQRKDRDRQRIREPENFELQWRDQSGKDHDRLASPLIVGPMPLRDEKFVPFALWLGRGNPQGGLIVAKRNQGEIPGSLASFDQLVAAGDQARYEPLAKGQQAAEGERMRTAFFDWLKKRYPHINLIPSLE